MKAFAEKYVGGVELSGRVDPDFAKIVGFMYVGLMAGFALLSIMGAASHF